MSKPCIGVVDIWPASNRGFRQLLELTARVMGVELVACTVQTGTTTLLNSMTGLAIDETTLDGLVLFVDEYRIGANGPNLGPYLDAVHPWYPICCYATLKDYNLGYANGTRTGMSASEAMPGGEPIGWASHLPQQNNAAGPALLAITSSKCHTKAAGSEAVSYLAVYNTDGQERHLAWYCPSRTGAWGAYWWSLMAYPRLILPWYLGMLGITAPKPISLLPDMDDVNHGTWANGLSCHEEIDAALLELDACLVSGWTCTPNACPDEKLAWLRARQTRWPVFCHPHTYSIDGVSGKYTTEGGVHTIQLAQPGGTRTSAQIEADMEATLALGRSQYGSEMLWHVNGYRNSPNNSGDWEGLQHLYNHGTRVQRETSPYAGSRSCRVSRLDSDGNWRSGVRLVDCPVGLSYSPSDSVDSTMRSYYTASDVYKYSSLLWRSAYLSNLLITSAIQCGGVSSLYIHAPWMDNQVNGGVCLNSKPSTGDTITIDDTTYTFAASHTDAGTVAIGSNIGDAATNLRSEILAVQGSVLSVGGVTTDNYTTRRIIGLTSKDSVERAITVSNSTRLYCEQIILRKPAFDLLDQVVFGLCRFIQMRNIRVPNLNELSDLDAWLTQ